MKSIKKLFNLLLIFILICNFTYLTFEDNPNETTNNDTNDNNGIENEENSPLLGSQASGAKTYIYFSSSYDIANHLRHIVDDII